MEHENPTQTAAGALRAEMARQKKTSGELAQVLGLSQSAASRRMSGDVELTASQIRVVSDWLGVSPAVLVPGEVVAS